MSNPVEREKWQIHVLQIHVLQIHVLQIHVLQIHLLQIHVLQIQSMFYKSNPVHVLQWPQRKSIEQCFSNAMWGFLNVSMFVQINY